MKKIALLFCVFIILSGCTSTPKVDIQAESNAIRNLEDQWTAAFITKNADKIMSLYAPDAVTMSSNKPTLTGIQAIQESIESLVGDTTLLFNSYKCTTDAIEVSTSGDLAYVLGHDEISKKTKDGLTKDEGRWIDIWKKFDGQWKISVGMSNETGQ
jgi:uncharacterized protein (TIGR02246 family)